MKASVIAVTVVLTAAACTPRRDREAGLPDYSADSTCQFVSVQAHPDPRQLVVEFVRRDADGLSLSHHAWADTATLCPGHTPGPDAFTVVSAYHQGSSHVGRDSAVFDVVYSRLGTTAYDSSGERIIVPDVRAETLHYSLLRTAYGWRVDFPDIPQRVLADSAKHLFPPTTARRIDSLARQIR